MLVTARPSDVKREAARLEYWRTITRDIVADQDAAFEREYRGLVGRSKPIGYGRLGQPIYPVSGGAPSLVYCLARLDQAAPVNNTFTGPQSIIGTTAAAGPVGPFSVDYFKTLGATWRQDCHGIISTTGTPTIAIGTYFGTVPGTITTVLAISPTITTATGLANIPWYYRATGRTLAVSETTSTMIVMGILFGDIEALGATIATEPIQFVVNATPPTAVTTDLSSAAFLDVKATFSASSVSNSITVNNYYLESLYS